MGKYKVNTNKISDKSPLFTITANMPRLKDLLLDLEEVASLTGIHVYGLEPLFRNSYTEYNGKYSSKNTLCISSQKSLYKLDSKDRTPESVQRLCWMIDLEGRHHLLKFLSYNKRFTRAMIALEAYQSTILDQPVVSRIVGPLTESWSRRFQLYRKTRRIFH